MQFSEDQVNVLVGLLTGEGADIIHLPYTSVFERVYTEFKQHTSVNLDRHELWELVLQVRSSPPRRQASPASAEPAPSTTESQPPPLSDPHQAPTPSFPEWLFTDVRGAGVRMPPLIPAPSTPIPDDVARRREQLLAAIARSELGGVEQGVAYMLQQFPETRDSDIALCIRYWRRFNADVLERFNIAELDFLFDLQNSETIGRVRREIQNKLQLFTGLEYTAQFRLLHQKKLEEYLAAHRGIVPEVRFYLDETGNEGNKAYTGVAGVCVMNWRQYEMHEAALSQWRQQQGPEPIHFVEIGSDRTARALGLLAELQRRRSGVLFLGYALRSHGSTREAMFSLIAQLVKDSLHHMKDGGSLNEPRLLRVIKEADDGFDSMYLEKLNKQLTELVDLDFPGQFSVLPVETVAKGREVLLECADLVAGGMQRRALYKGNNPKDILAAAVFNVTGFEDSKDEGAIFQLYPSAS